MACCSSQLQLEAAPTPPKTMDSLELYFSRLILRELEHFRDGLPKPEEGTGTEVATSPASTRAQTPDSATTIDSKDDKQQAADQAPQDIDALIDADEAANGFQGKPVKLIVLHNTTKQQRKNNDARLQRIYRLAQKLEVAPGGPRWVREGKPYMQPAVPRAVLHANGNVEYNQFMHDDAGEVVLRMPGGWKRDLVRSRPQFQGVAIIDGYLWPRFSPNLPRRMTVDWEEQGFVEFNEVRYTTRFIAREPKPAPRGSSNEEDGILIRFDD